MTSSDNQHQAGISGQQQQEEQQSNTSNETPTQQIHNQEQFMVGSVSQGDYLFADIDNRHEHHQDIFSSSENYNICNTYDYQMRSSPRDFTSTSFELSASSNAHATTPGEYSMAAESIHPLSLEVPGNTTTIAPTHTTSSTFPPHSSLGMPTTYVVQNGACPDNMFIKNDPSNGIGCSNSKRKHIDLEPESAYKRLRADSNYDHQLYYQFERSREGALTQTLTTKSVSGASKRSSAWTKNEEAKLQHLVNAGVKWQDITREFPNRSAGAIKKHYYADMKNIPWSEEEDSLLQQFFKEHETWKWKDIGEKIGKPAAACKKRMKQLQQKTMGYSNQIGDANGSASGSGCNPDEY